MLVGDPNNPDGGLLERFPGFYIPFLNVHFNGATPPNSPYPTSIYTIQYDGIADAPQYPLNVVSDLNAFLGYFVLHSNYPFLTPDQVAGAVQLATSPGYTGNTQYYMVMTQNLPLIQFIRDIPYAGPPIADIFQPDLRVLVDLGYGDIGPGGGYANLPTPASLFSVPNVPESPSTWPRGPCRARGRPWWTLWSSRDTRRPRRGTRTPTPTCRPRIRTCTSTWASPVRPGCPGCAAASASILD